MGRSGARRTTGRPCRRAGTSQARTAGEAGYLDLDQPAAHDHLPLGRAGLRHQEDSPAIQMRQARPAGGCRRAQCRDRRRHHQPHGRRRRRSQAAYAEPVPLDCGESSASRPGRADRLERGPLEDQERPRAREHVLSAAARPPPRMFKESETNQEVAVEKLGADSCGKLLPCHPLAPRFIPVSGPPPPRPGGGGAGPGPAGRVGPNPPWIAGSVDQHGRPALPFVSRVLDGCWVQEPNHREDRSGRP